MADCTHGSFDFSQSGSVVAARRRSLLSAAARVAVPRPRPKDLPQPTACGRLAARAAGSGALAAQ
jgi:hypothetical protein